MLAFKELMVVLLTTDTHELVCHKTNIQTTVDILDWSLN